MVLLFLVVLADLASANNTTGVREVSGAFDVHFGDLAPA
jgi:hypothetical protein